MIAKVAAQVFPQKNTASKRILIIGADKLGKQVAQIIMNSTNGSMEIRGFVDDKKSWMLGDIPVLGSLDSDLNEIVAQHDINEVVVALSHELPDALAVKLETLNIPVRVIPSYVNLALYSSITELSDLPLMENKHYGLTERERMVKRAFDIFVSATFLLAVLPVMAVIAIAIKLDSPGPIFYMAERMGENGKKFRMMKFRSMVVNAEKLQAQVNQVDENGNIIHKHRNDPRVTRIGRILRKTSLDELPQFINVLKGDMSLVGPRPELPWLVEEYQPWQHRRFIVPQGITGWWQVNGRSDMPCHLNTDQDLYYIENYSFKLDIIILLKTVPALLKGKGAF